MPNTFWARIDSSTAGNPSLNLTVDPAIQITFVNEDIDGNPGDYLLDDVEGIDDDTVVSIGGTNYEFSFELAGTLPTLNSDGANQLPPGFPGEPVYLITVYDYPSDGETTRLMFPADGTQTEADMNAFGTGKIDLLNQDTTPDPDDYVCFSAGTKIRTESGEKPVEDLHVGEAILTVEGTALSIVWTGTSNLNWPGASENHRPYLVASGALGPDTPARDLVVSPQHKVMMHGAVVRSMFGVDQVLAPVKGLTGLRGVRQMQGKRHVTYVHLLLERHAVILSEGAPTESLYPGPVARTMLGKAEWRQLESLFPGVSDNPETAYGPRARFCITRRQAEALVDRILAERSASGGRAAAPEVAHAV